MGIDVLPKNARRITEKPRSSNAKDQREFVEPSIRMGNTMQNGH
jgi:hypothetical protein